MFFCHLLNPCDISKLHYTSRTHLGYDEIADTIDRVVALINCEGVCVRSDIIVPDRDRKIELLESTIDSRER